MFTCGPEEPSPRLIPETETRPDGSNGHRQTGDSMRVGWGDGGILGSSEVFQFFFQIKGRYYNNLEALVSAMFAQIGAYDNLWCRCNADSALCFGRQGLKTTLVQRIQKILSDM